MHLPTTTTTKTNAELHTFLHNPAFFVVFFSHPFQRSILFVVLSSPPLRKGGLFSFLSTKSICALLVRDGSNNCHDNGNFGIISVQGGKRSWRALLREHFLNIAVWSQNTLWGDGGKTHIPFWTKKIQY